jgi:hypothetical protein
LVGFTFSRRTRGLKAESDVRSDRRQLGNLAQLLPFITPFAPIIQPVNTTTRDPEKPGPGVKRTVITYGPFTLRAPKGAWSGNLMSLDPQGTAHGYMIRGFPSNVTLLLPKLLIVNEDGSEIANANKVYNHHAFVYDVSRGSRANIQCAPVATGKSLMAVNALLGSSADFSPDALVSSVTKVGGNQMKVGNYIGSNQQLLLSTDLVNYNPEPRNVYVVADLTYLEGKAVGYYETALHLISVGTCESWDPILGGLFIRPPTDKNQWSLKGESMVKDDGKIVAIRGHMHGTHLPPDKIEGQLTISQMAVTTWC